MMRLHRIVLALAVFACLAGIAYVRQTNDTVGERMASAADKFLATLNEKQKAKATYEYDDKERLNWHFVPLQDNKKNPTRLGVRMQEMTEAQKIAARALLQSGTSRQGYLAATTIMSLESILRELETGGTIVRDPGWYFFTVFGKPSKTGKWGWRVEGHHLSLNFTLDGGQIVSATPAFFGANPATVKQGKQSGKRAIPEAEDLAKDLFKSLDDDQKKIAVQEKQFREIEGHTRKPTLSSPAGLAAAKMREEQRSTLYRLLESYADRMPAEVARVEIEKVKKTDPEKLYFAYAGGVNEGQPHSYRVQGPEFVVEFLNIQADSAKNPANHIHSAWRNTKGDFGLSN